MSQHRLPFVRFRAMQQASALFVAVCLALPSPAFALRQVNAGMEESPVNRELRDRFGISAGTQKRVASGLEEPSEKEKEIFPPMIPNLEPPYESMESILADSGKRNYERLSAEAQAVLSDILIAFSGNPGGTLENEITSVRQYLKYSEHLLELQNDERVFLRDMDEAFSQLTHSLFSVRDLEKVHDLVTRQFNIINANHFVDYLHRAYHALIQRNIPQRLREAMNVENRRKREIKSVQALFNPGVENVPDMQQDFSSMSVTNYQPEERNELYTGKVTRDESSLLFAMFEPDTITTHAN